MTSGNVAEAGGPTPDRRGPLNGYSARLKAIECGFESHRGHPARNLHGTCPDPGTSRAVRALDRVEPPRLNPPVRRQRDGHPPASKEETMQSNNPVFRRSEEFN